MSDGSCHGGSDHVWRLEEVLVEDTAADLVSTCLRCGMPGLQAGHGRSVRPPLEEFPD